MPSPVIAVIPVHTLAAADDELKVIVIVGGLVFASILVIVRSFRKVSETREREQTRREIAAYVAEGSITPDDATRILSAGMSEAVATELARGVTWGMVSPAKAQKLVQALNQQPPGGPPPQPVPPR